VVVVVVEMVIQLQVKPLMEDQVDLVVVLVCCLVLVLGVMDMIQQHQDLFLMLFPFHLVAHMLLHH